MKGIRNLTKYGSYFIIRKGKKKSIGKGLIDTMTEEINNLNTDLKELFVNNQLEEAARILNETEDSIVVEITLYNYEVIKKYYDSQKFSILIQHIKFTAFSCYLCEYSANRQLIGGEDFEGMSQVFNDIYSQIKQ